MHSVANMATETATPNGDMHVRTRAGDKRRPVISSKSPAFRRRGTAGKALAQQNLDDEDELDLAGDLPPRTMTTIFGPSSSRPKLSTRSSSRRSLGSAQGTNASGPSTLGTPLSFHSARSSAMSYFTASLELLESRTEWLMDITQAGLVTSGIEQATTLQKTDRWLQTMQTLKRLGLETIEDPKKLKQAYFQYICDAAKRSNKVREAITSRILTKGPVFSSEWMKHLDARGILTHELDWSGRGEHVEYAPREKSKIPLVHEENLGYGNSAMVDCVRCRRIRLARKTIKCSRSMKKTEAISEVEHLQKLRHSHIVRVVGTYTIAKELAILLYPVAHWNLTDFLAEVNKRSRSLYVNVSDYLLHNSRSQAWIGVESLITFFGCISNAVSFIHSHNIRHMDFKPGNFLVRFTENCHPLLSSTYKIYVADFGVARAYKSAAESETDSGTSFTPRYAAPEVAEQEMRGYSSDIFSIGCVFMEMMAAILSCSAYNELLGLKLVLEEQVGRRETWMCPYRIKTKEVNLWFQEALERCSRSRKRKSILGRIDQAFLDLLPRMLHPKPKCRPSAKELEIVTRSLQCGQCNSGPEPFEAAESSATWPYR